MSPLLADTVEKRFCGPECATLIQNRGAYAISIQIPCCSDSIVAFGRIADDFFNSIGQKQTLAHIIAMSALLPEADIALRDRRMNAAVQRRSNCGFSNSTEKPSFAK